MRLMHWNIRQGGGKRCSSILDAIIGQQPDCVVLMEFRERNAASLRAGLRANGLTYQLATPGEGSTNRILFASRTPFTQVQSEIAPPFPARWLNVRLTNSQILIGAAHIPGWSDGKPLGDRKMRSWNHLLEMSQKYPNDPMLLVGDFNTGVRCVDETGRTFKASECLKQLQIVGWKDAWRHKHGDKREYTWFSRTGSGFRIDHAFCTSSILPLLQDARYLHHAREAKFSDHSPLIVEWLGT